MRTLRVVGVDAIRQRGHTYIIIKLTSDVKYKRTIEIALLKSEYEVLVRGARRALNKLKYGGEQGPLDAFMEGGGEE